jgi:UDP-glucose 4-epimerase
MFVVTGGSGFLGRSIVRMLVRSALPVTRVIRREAAPEPSVIDLPITDYCNLPRFMETSILIHAGEPADIGTAQALGEAHIERMEEMTDALLSRRFAGHVYISSAVVYGDELDTRRREDEPVGQRGYYAKAKEKCEAKVLACGGAVIRLSNLFGSGMARNTLIGDVLAQIPGEGPVKLRDDAPVRDYVFVEDAARAVVACATRKVAGVFNVGSGLGISAGDLARNILEVAGEPDRPIVATLRSGRPSYLVLDVSKSSQVLDWRPQVSLSDGLTRMLKSAA